MIGADLIALITIIFCFVGGASLGFGRWLKILTGGVVGRIISVIVCYFLFGIVLDWYFVRAFMQKITEALQENGGWFANVLLTIRLDLIVFGALLFIAVQGLRKLLVYIIANVMQSDYKAISVFNRFLGVVLLTAFAAIVMLVVFQVVAWVLGTGGGLYPALQNSVFGLDKIYINNPLNSLIDSIRLPIQNETESFVRSVLF